MNISLSYSSRKSAIPQKVNHIKVRSSKQQCPKSTVFSMARNNDIAFSELLFFKHKCARKTNEKEPSTKQPAVKSPRKKGV